MAIIKNNAKPIIVGSNPDQNWLEVLSFTLIWVETSGFLSPKSLSESFVGNTTTSLFTFSIPFSWVFDPESVAIALFPSITTSEYFSLMKFCSKTFRATSLSSYFCASLTDGNTNAIIIEIIIKIANGL